MDDANFKPDETASALSQQELDQLTDQLVEKLKTVYDPEIPVDIYELGLIYKVDVSDGRGRHARVGRGRGDVGRRDQVLHRQPGV